MNKIFAIVLLAYTMISAQQSSRYFDAPFGGGGGYSPAWYIPKMDALNEQVKAFGVPGLSSGGFFASGGGGFIYLGIVPGLRIGGMGFGGSTSESSSSNGLNKEVIYSISGGGFSIEYTIPYVRDFGISVGAIIGGGSFQIEIYQNSDNYQWDQVWDVPSGTPTDISRTLNNSYWTFSPTFNIDIPFYRFALFRIGAGYQIALSEDWTVDNDRNLSGVPSEINGNCFFIQSGIFVGFFSF